MNTSDSKPTETAPADVKPIDHLHAAVEKMLIVMHQLTALVPTGHQLGAMLAEARDRLNQAMGLPSQAEQQQAAADAAAKEADEKAKADAEAKAAAEQAAAEKDAADKAAAEQAAQDAKKK